MKHMIGLLTCKHSVLLLMTFAVQQMLAQTLFFFEFIDCSHQIITQLLPIQI